ncbi:serine hydrolase [Candidatus Bathyarchaeota archaeon]|nr:serine hydrolase [Candidatus Bathyarchaeota archaeon]MBS7612929.1 serine hydrolase [Candidatus Bathyarchaeota archaeon]MBS7618010.1 serine hydrolase [Candidatus Bathyarchaeota archaeon]
MRSLLRFGNPSEAGLNSEKLLEALNVLEGGVKDGVYPGFVALVARKAVIALYEAEGYAQLIPEVRPMIREAVFDLASITKPICTATLTLKIVERGLLDLETPLSEFLDGWDRGWRKNVRIKHLLTHSSGLPAWLPLYKTCRGKSEFLNVITQLDCEYEPGFKIIYSDLGFILLGFILESVSELSLDRLSKNEIFEPLKMSETMFKPIGSLKAKAVATENCPWRGRVLVGEVHDENAYALGGVAGHAGLFSTAYDLAVFSQMMLNRGFYGLVRILREETVEKAVKVWVEDGFRRFGLGWAKPLGLALPHDSYGHTGFTGTSIWISPKLDLFAILLTNRIHPSRNNPACGRIDDVRAAFHRLIVEAIVD